MENKYIYNPRTCTRNPDGPSRDSDRPLGKEDSFAEAPVIVCNITSKRNSPPSSLSAPVFKAGAVFLIRPALSGCAPGPILGIAICYFCAEALVIVYNGKNKKKLSLRKLNRSTGRKKGETPPDFEMEY